MGFTYNDIHSKDMGLKARLTSWQVSGRLRNFTTTVPGKYGVADFGADLDYREITAACSIFPRHTFSALVETLDGIAAWLDPTQGLHQLIFDDVPDRYFMARLNDAVDCERLIRAAGSFSLKFFCPDPFGYALEDEEFSITAAGTHTAKRETGNAESLPIYRITGTISGSGSITITTNGSALRIANASLTEGETLVVDTDKMTAWVESGAGITLRNGLPYLAELNFPTLAVGENMVQVEVSGAALTKIEIQARSRWR